MLFNSIQFAVFFPIAVLVYFIIPYRFRNIWLLVTSYFYYMCWRKEYALLMLSSTLITYLSALFMEGRSLGAKKAAVAVSFILNLSILGFFKYFHFFFDSLDFLVDKAGGHLDKPAFDVLLPVGISFYIFQALSYTMDVYRGEVKCEKNFLKYALFVSFFPQLVAGPIERSKNLLSQFDERHEFEYKRVRDGLFRMLWGFFLKLVLVARLSVIVDLIYGNSADCTGYQLMLGTFFFALQIYCDFSGYSEIAIGAAKVLGFTLMENFRQPFFATSCKELWNRWHISLNTWFRDYLYFPLGGSRKGVFRKYVNLMIVFAVSGLWHGAAWTFVVWGVLSGLFQVFGDLLRPLRKRLRELLHIGEKNPVLYVLSVIMTFMFFCISLVFFRSQSMEQALFIMKSIFTAFDFGSVITTSPASLGLGVFHLAILIFSLIILFAVDLYKEKGYIFTGIFARRPLVRWGFYYMLVTLIILSANFGAEEFIYFRF